MLLHIHHRDTPPVHTHIFPFDDPAQKKKEDENSPFTINLVFF